jgi:hypothetical protein
MLRTSVKITTTLVIFAKLIRKENFTTTSKWYAEKMSTPIS